MVGCVVFGGDCDGGSPVYFEFKFVCFFVMVSSRKFIVLFVLFLVYGVYVLV